MSRKKIIWTVLSLLLACFCIWEVISMSKDFSGELFVNMLKTASPIWLGAALLCMIGFIVFEAEAIRCIIRVMGYGKPVRTGITYSAADIYFSAVTPSASGGQPASAYFMIKDGIPIAVVTVSLLVNLVMYTAAILFVGILCIICRADIFMRFNFISRLLIAAGYCILLVLALLFCILLKKAVLLESFLNGCINLLKKLHIIRYPERKREKLQKVMTEYRMCAEMVADKRKMLVKVFLWNILQRISQITVTMMAFLATGGKFGQASDIWVTQSFVAIGSNCVPIPGAMGVADYLMLDGFSAMLDELYTTNLELLSRGISFYSCILICGAIVAVNYIKRTWRKKK